MNLLDYLPTVTNFPKPGINFKDISPLLADTKAFAETIEQLFELSKFCEYDYLLGIESRGFIFATALAAPAKAGLVLARKPNKLPGKTITESYGLEYGVDALEIQTAILPQHAKVLLVDDVLATGGTLMAAANLVKRSGASVVGAIVLLEILELGGAKKMQTHQIHMKSLLSI